MSNYNYCQIFVFFILIFVSPINVCSLRYIIIFILDGSCENDPYQESGGMADYPPSPESWIGDGMENAPPGQGNPIGHIPPSSGPGGPQPPYE